MEELGEFLSSYLALVRNLSVVVSAGVFRRKLINTRPRVDAIF